MLGQNEARSLALFFFYACLDEARAKETASRAADEYERLLKNDPEMDPVQAVVKASSKVWTLVRARMPRGRPSYANGSGWILPANADLGHWKEFQKSAPEDELLAVIWILILGFKEESVSRALKLTEGTLRHRVGRGVRKLGNQLSGTGRPFRPMRLQ